MRDESSSIGQGLLDWYDIHARDLPWRVGPAQRAAGVRPDPYRVWLSEIMLQQTTVAAVKDYFTRFTLLWPEVGALAAAEDARVMGEWAGLGYYARARNLHAAARTVAHEHNGVFPRSVEGLMALPGIGRSTAGAIVAQAFGIWAPILDGNAKRVIARLAGVSATPGTSAYENKLWPLAERYTPATRVTDYTQAIMDLGATLCTRRRPACGRCPLADGCLAREAGTQDTIPAPRKKKTRPERMITMLVVEDSAGRLLLEKRPPSGIWGGLWSLPELPSDRDIEGFCRERLAFEVRSQTRLAPISHGLTHFVLHIHAYRVQGQSMTRIMDANLAWFAPDARPGVPAAIARLLDTPQSDLNL